MHIKTNGFGNENYYCIKHKPDNLKIQTSTRLLNLRKQINELL